ncbi:MAG TPA: FAD-binding oxidoreductase [Solirubrobacteraceae bacterium]
MTEVVVVGAGIAGVCTARELALRGVDVCLLDAGEVSGGTTGLGEGNVLCSDKDAGPELSLALLGRALYDEIEASLGDVAQIRRKGALIVHPEAATWAAEPARVARLAAAGVDSALLGPEEVREREPALTGELHGASYFAEDLQCAPRAITRALAREVPRVLTRCRVESIEAGGVRTERGFLAADAVVLAAGAWSGALAASAGLELPVEPRWGQLVQLASPVPIRHKVVDGSYLASVTDPGAELQVSTVLETTFEGDVLVGSSRARRGFSDAVDPAVTEAMLARAARLMPGLRGGHVARAWSGLRPWLPDHLPAIGPSRAVEGLWVNTGHEGAGVALGPVSGRLLAQALCGEPTLADLAPFDPDRFAAVSAR